jgi:soluble lytic murein transglycosylase
MSRRRVAISGAALLLRLAAAAAVAPPVSGASPPPYPGPLVPILEHELAGRLAEALRASAAAAADPAALRLGLDYLRGDLLERLGRHREAADAFAAAMVTAPGLSAWARHRLALAQVRLGHPEVAAGLVATLLGAEPPAELVAPASRLLRSTLAAGGDCRLLRGVPHRRFAAPERRELQLAHAECLLRAGHADQAAAALLAVLEEDPTDELAHQAAERAAALPAAHAGGRGEILLGLVFHHHREFDRAARYLEQGLARWRAGDPRDPADVSPTAEYEALYALHRSHFWEGRYRAAASGFHALAESTADPGRAAQALFQGSRCLELLGEWHEAARGFRRAYLRDPRGDNAAAALISALRLEWRSLREDDALELYALLVSQRRWHDTAARAALFLASSELVRGRAPRAGAWLAQAEIAGGREHEVAYWRGRLAELEGRPAAAIQAYLRVLRYNPHHLLADAARRRLAAEPLAPAARAAALRLARGESADGLYGAWLLLGEGDESGRAAREALLGRLSADRRASPFLRLRAVPPAEWPLWRAPRREAPEMLLALGLWREGGTAVLRHFPTATPSLAFTAAGVLAGAGLVHRSLYVAETLSDGVPQRLPTPLLPRAFRTLLYPVPYREAVERETRRRRVDPWLVFAILREESRFDPQAVSAAAARGLGQFVLPTARRLAPQIGRRRLAPRDLEQPEVSIALAAAYLQGLVAQHGGAEPLAVAAYNAGEPQAALWRSYCWSREPEEFYTKVAFRETRGYLGRVLASRRIYAELYGAN